MRPPEQVKLELVRQWLAKADNDLETAKFLFASGRPFFSAICFHSQQAAEKYFKALLTWHQIEFPKTHDLELLLAHRLDRLGSGFVIDRSYPAQSLRGGNSLSRGRSGDY
jgi:HEPN domain-containing protein